LTAIWKNDPALQPMARAELKNMRCAPFAVVPAVVSFFLKPSSQAACGGLPPVTPTSDSGNLKTFACHFGCFPTGLILTFPVLILWLYRTGSLLMPYN